MIKSVYPQGYPEGAIVRLQALLDAVCPNEGVSIGRFTDRTTWQLHSMSNAKQAEIAAAQAILDTFDPWAFLTLEPSAPLDEIRDAYENSFADDGDAGAVDSDPADIDPSGDIGELSETAEDALPGDPADYSAEPVGDDSALGEPGAYPGVMVTGDPLKAAQMEATWAVGDKEEALVSQYAADENLARLNEMRGIALAIKEGVHPPFDEDAAAELQALETFASWLSSVRANADRLRNAIRIAGTIEEVQAVDLETGWPE